MKAHCTSGGEIGRPCDRLLSQIGRTMWKDLPVMVCRHCDCLPIINKKQP